MAWTSLRAEIEAEFDSLSHVDTTEHLIRLHCLRLQKRREYYANTALHHRARERARYAKLDPEIKRALLAKQAARLKVRYQTDPIFREKCKARNRSKKT